MPPQVPSAGPDPGGAFRRWASGGRLPGLLGASLWLLTGCGIHYYDARTGVEHLWGFGHLQMRVQPPTNGVTAAITGNEVVGVRVGAGVSEYGLSVGYDSRRMVVVDPSAAPLVVAWPEADFFSVRVGSHLPFPTNLPGGDPLPLQPQSPESP